MTKQAKRIKELKKACDLYEENGMKFGETWNSSTSTPEVSKLLLCRVREMIDAHYGPDDIARSLAISIDDAISLFNVVVRSLNRVH